MIKVSELEDNIEHVVFEGIDKFNALVADDARKQLVRLFDTANSKVIIDLEGIKYIDSSGFGCFLTTMKSARNNFGVLKICNLHPEVKTLFLTLQLHTIFELYDDLDTCKSSF